MQDVRRTSMIGCAPVAGGVVLLLSLGCGEDPGSDTLGGGGAESYTTNGTTGATGGNPGPGFGVALHAIAAAEEHTCGISDSADVYCWGSNGRRQLGVASEGPDQVEPLPVRVPGVSGAAHVAVFGGELGGSGGSCAVTNDGSLLCWGATLGGLTSDPTKPPEVQDYPLALDYPGPVLDVESRVPTQLCVVYEYGVTGENIEGVEIQCTPAEFVAGAWDSSNLAVEVASVAVSYHTCVLLVDGTAACRGTNNSGQVNGTGRPTDVDEFIPVEFVENAVELVVGAGHTCTRSALGEVRCWGGNNYGQLGTGPTSMEPSLPVTVQIPPAVALAAGYSHTCAILEDASVMCWGANGHGQLGNGRTADSTVPVVVSGLNSIVAIAAGEFHTCAVDTDGAAWCWGRNDSGQLGDGSTSSRLSPVRVGG